MKIKLSKSQWEGIGKKAGWMPERDNENKGVDIFQFVEDWGKEGYGIALVDPDRKIVTPYIDPSDYPDMILNKSGNGAKVISGKYKDYSIIFHSGIFEGNIGKDWTDFTVSTNKTAARQKITKPQNIVDAPKEIKASDLYKQFIQEGKKPRQAAEELLDILSSGAFVAIEEPKRTEMINSVIEKFSK